MNQAQAKSKSNTKDSDVKKIKQQVKEMQHEIDRLASVGIDVYSILPSTMTYLHSLEKKA